MLVIHHFTMSVAFFPAPLFVLGRIWTSERAQLTMRYLTRECKRVPAKEDSKFRTAHGGNVGWIYQLAKLRSSWRQSRDMALPVLRARRAL